MTIVVKRAALVIGLVALCTSCQKFGEGRQMFRDLLTLRDQLAAQFHEKVVDVSVSTGGRVTVKFIHSPLNSATRDMKQKRADEVAAFVVSHYRHPVTSVSTHFVSGAGPARLEETYVGQSAPTANRGQ
jgi:hypothetical protein